MKPAASTQKHSSSFPSARKIKRACENELYRTIKRLGVYIPKEKVELAEKLYVQKVFLNLQWIHENASNRKLLSDWWDENVSGEIASLWEVDQDRLRKSFRDAFGG
ncbi:dehydrogenase [Paenibacillus sacheonensis]|uniref:Dehydrogenase n=1 Tax=Paenibacillus sacheonensis TaxID=742054 RepID=A0A7X4YP15_9BACL|nr:dehydrogenase [Paenibacillus sacheonensis]MBM7567370.1 toxin CptA [Paenibacillus sacheonensis]NBC69848.1 dehydrogenase [Paenibacillus sacheonensis]